MSGDLFNSKAEALVNTVNCVGVMGKGIALRFKQLYPANYRVYKRKCQLGKVKIGYMLVLRDTNVRTGLKWIVNFPTKQHWQKPSSYTYIELGLRDLVTTIHEFEFKSIAIPALGCTNGGLNWNQVKILMEQHLSKVDCNIEIYSPH